MRILISDLWQSQAYFAGKEDDCIDDLDKELFKLVKTFDDTVSIGKFIGTPERYFSESQKIELKEHGLKESFDIV